MMPQELVGVSRKEERGTGTSFSLSLSRSSYFPCSLSPHFLGTCGGRCQRNEVISICVAIVRYPVTK